MCDLEALFGALAKSVPTGVVEDNGILLTSSLLPVVQTTLTSDRLIIRKTIHQYGSYYRSDVLEFHAQQLIYRCLGLLILSVLFHNRARSVRLDLVHPKSDIRHMVITISSSNEWEAGYHTEPSSFLYRPREPKAHPWYDLPGHQSPNDLPCFLLTNLEDRVVDSMEWGRRDTVRGFGSDIASARFAELLLDVGRPESQEVEYELEGEGGFRGVGIHSAEARLWLPGSFGWHVPD